MMAPLRMQQSRKTHDLRADSPQGGFSVVELLVVVSIIVILAAVTVFSLTASRRSYAAEDEASQIVSFFRDAYHRALSQRQTFRVSIDRNRGVVLLMDEGRMPGGDEVEIIRGTLNNEVSMVRPQLQGGEVVTPPAPYNYNSAVFDNGLWVARFRADGSVVDAAGNSISATLFFSPLGVNDQNRTLIRAVTLFGPSASVRAWKYDGAGFIAEANQ